MRHLVARSLFWLVWTRAGINVVSIVNTIALARLLTPTDFGLAGLAMIWIEIISALAELGMGAAIIQFRDLQQEDLNTSFWLTMLLSAIGYGALFVASPGLEAWFRAPHLAVVLRVASVSLLLVGLRVVPDGLLRRDIQLDKVAKAQMLGSILGAGSGIVTAVLGGGVWSIVIGSLATALASTCATYAYCNWVPGLRLESRQFGAVVNFSIASLGSKLAFVIQMRLDEFVVGKTLGQIPLGFYLMGRNIAMMPVDRMSGIVSQVSVSLMASLQAQRTQQADLLLQSTRLVAVVSFPVCIGMLLVAPDLIAFALGPKWLPAVPVFRVLCAYAALRSIAILLPPLLSSQRRQWFLFVYSCTLIAALLPALWLGAHVGGILGAACAYLLVTPFAIAWLAHETFRSARVQPLEFLRQLATPAASCVLMTVAVVLTYAGLDAWGMDAALPRLLATSAVGAVAYAGGVLCSGSPVVDEVRTVLGWILRPRGGEAAPP